MAGSEAATSAGVRGEFEEHFDTFTRTTSVPMTPIVHATPRLELFDAVPIDLRFIAIPHCPAG
ncbi:hypothetical protein NS355_01770 [Sphingomonas yabuuchiae]|uniref:Uncharacterized protein n=1 Tax=Sphingomonas yabuuchiae TaxID=172044 RepID=A0A147IYQ3_9SPHN|nr:hypothetical protein NS355_01770 [Sphingomonas yabuuchiae]